MRSTKLRIPAAGVRTGTKVCLCHLQSAFPQPMNWNFALPTTWHQSVVSFFFFFSPKTFKESSSNSIHLEACP